MTCESAYEWAIAAQFALGAYFLWMSVRLHRDRTVFRKLRAGWNQEASDLYDELCRKIRLLPERWLEYVANPDDPKWARGLFYDDPGQSVH